MRWLVKLQTRESVRELYIFQSWRALTYIKTIPVTILFRLIPAGDSTVVLEIINLVIINHKINDIKVNMDIYMQQKLLQVMLEWQTAYNKR